MAGRKHTAIDATADDLGPATRGATATVSRNERSDWSAASGTTGRSSSSSGARSWQASGKSEPSRGAVLSLHHHLEDTPPVRTTTIAAAAALAVVALLGCGSEDASEDGDDAVASTGTSDAPACADLAEDLPGTPTDDIIVEGAACTTEQGRTELLGFHYYDCTDGRRLSWNDHGWGFSGETWQAHTSTDGELAPPDAEVTACTGMEP